MIASNNVLYLLEVKATNKLLGRSFGQMSQNQARNEVFCHFLKFDSLVFF